MTMSTTLTFASAAALFVTMVLLAAVPGVSTVTVVARTLAHGLRHGGWTTLGIVTGDVLFIVVALFGLGALAATAAAVFDVARIGAGAYLLHLGIRQWRRTAAPAAAAPAADTRSSFLAGLLITAGDLKALLFYLALLPAYVDPGRASALDAVLIATIAAVAVGGTKLAYAYAAVRFGSRSTPSRSRLLERAAAAALAVAGATLLGLVAVEFARR